VAERVAKHSESPSTARAGKPDAETTRSEIDDTRQALLRVLSVGGVAFVAFLPLDLYVRSSHYPDVSPWWCIAWRGGGSLVILLTWLLVRARQRWSATGLLLAGGIVMSISLAALGAMSVKLGGLGSSYLFSPAFYAVGMSTFVPTRWPTSVLIAGPAIFLFVGSIVVGVALSPVYASQLDDPPTIALFIQNILRITGIVAFAVVSGHVLWRARTRLRDAYRLGRYLLKHPIGQGGMNEIWLAWDSHLKREVALKLLHSRHPEDARRARFEREAHATSALHSPHTVRIFDYGESGRGTFWIAMEYLRGQDLDKIVATHGALDPRRALHFARQAAAALAEAHQGGLVHRDVKPANLLALSSNEEADFLKVLDFGIARQLDSGEATLTLIGMVVGTPAFMAPEVQAGIKADPSSDVWSFGATLYTLLTGTLPFEYSAYSRHGTARARLVPPSERLGRPLPAELDALVMRCMHIDPALRPADGAALIEALAGVPLAPWTPDDARGWWSSHVGTLSNTLADASNGASAGPTEVNAPTVSEPRQRG